MYYENFYVKAPLYLLEVPIPLTEFKKEDNSYMTIPEYLKQFDQVITAKSKDNWMHGFSFNLEGLDEFRNKISEFGLELGVNVFILSFNEAQEELQKDEWNETSVL